MPNLQELSAQLSVAENWSTYGSTPGSYVLTDPLTRQHLDTDSPPLYIAHDPMFEQGFAYLRERRDNIAVTVALVAHDIAESLGDMQRNWYERQVFAADYYGYESFAHTTTGIQINNDIGRSIVNRAIARNEIPSRKHFIDYCERNNRAVSSFAARRLAATILSGTPSFSYDLAADGAIAERATLATFDAVLESSDIRAGARAHIGVQNAREWCAVAKIGTLLRAHESLQDQQAQKIGVFATIGAAHIDIGRKLRTTGVQVALKRVTPSNVQPDLTELPLQMGQIFESGIIATDDMPYLVGLARSVRESGQNY